MWMWMREWNEYRKESRAKKRKMEEQRKVNNVYRPYLACFESQGDSFLILLLPVWIRSPSLAHLLTLFTLIDSFDTLLLFVQTCRCLRLIQLAAWVFKVAVKGRVILISWLFLCPKRVVCTDCSLRARGARLPLFRQRSRSQSLSLSSSFVSYS